MSEAPVWINGSFAGRIDARDRGLTLGDGVFDTLVAFRNVPFAGEKHLERLQAQAGAIGIAIDPEEVRAGWNAVLGRAEGEHTILRTTVTGGAGGRGLWPRWATTPTVIVSGAAWGHDLFGKPVRLVTSRISRDPGSPSSGLKSLGYLDPILAAREARARDADDALFLTPAGRVSCTTIANVFAVVGDRLITPPLSDAVQPGIMRRLVVDAAARLGLQAGEHSLSADELRSADQVFLTNSVRFLCPCASLDAQPLSRNGAEMLGKLTDAIRAQVLDTCGLDPGSGRDEPSKAERRDGGHSTAAGRG